MDNVLDFVEHKINKSSMSKRNMLSKTELKLCDKLGIDPERYLETLKDGPYGGVRQSSTVSPNTAFNVAIVSKGKSLDRLGVLITGTEDNSDSVYFRYDKVFDLMEALKYAADCMKEMRGE